MAAPRKRVRGGSFGARGRDWAAAIFFFFFIARAVGEGGWPKRSANAKLRQENEERLANEGEEKKDKEKKKKKETKKKRKGKREKNNGKEKRSVADCTGRSEGPQGVAEQRCFCR